MSTHIPRSGGPKVLPNNSQRHRLFLSIVLPSLLSLSCAQQSPVVQGVPATTPTPSPTPVVILGNAHPMPTPIIGKPYPGKGVVTIVNLKEGWVELNHEEIEGLMPPMQMEWPVKPKSLLKSIKVGDKVEFTVVETGKGEILTSIKKLPSQ